MVVKGSIKKYMGAIPSEEIAARYYDKYLIIIKGIKVRFNSSEIFPVVQNKLLIQQKSDTIAAPS